jgi:hypothetical protein
MGFPRLVRPRKTGALSKGGAGLAFGALIGGAIGLVGVAALTAAVPTTTYRDGPPPGVTGGFGEQSCHACHFDADLNDGVGSLAISGVPDRFVAGRTYPLTVTLSRPELAISGFQLAARFDDGGAQAGALILGPHESERASITTDRDIAYAFQLAAGSVPTAPDTARWVILWTAPETGGAVRFNAAANAANGDDSADGDYVYTAEVVAEGG